MEESTLNMPSIGPSSPDFFPEYRSKSGVLVAGIHPERATRMLSTLTQQYGISVTQIVESASFSMAMVVRAALGLSAAGGRSCVLATDTLGGMVALATARHLANGGADPLVVLVSTSEQPSADLQQQLTPLGQMGIPIFNWSPSGNEKEFSTLLESCHNCILGITELANTTVTAFHEPLVQVLNELPTPLHCIHTPLGIDSATGAAAGTPVFASSTLSLGIPLAGLTHAREHLGRHYVCDISVPRALYAAEGQDLTMLFADQPVVQLLPADEEKPGNGQAGTPTP